MRKKTPEVRVTGSGSMRRIGPIRWRDSDEKTQR